MPFSCMSCKINNKPTWRRWGLWFSQFFFQKPPDMLRFQYFNRCYLFIHPPEGVNSGSLLEVVECLEVKLLDKPWWQPTELNLMMIPMYTVYTPTLSGQVYILYCHLYFHLHSLWSIKTTTLSLICTSLDYFNSSDPPPIYNEEYPLIISILMDRVPTLVRKP